MKKSKSMFSSFRVHGTRRKAFSLPETIIALVILSVAILAIAFVPIMSSKMMLQTTQREQAMFLAMKGLDYLESVSPDVAVSDTVPEGMYTLIYQKPLYSAATASNYKATVTVRWTGLAGQSELILERNLSRLSHETRHKQEEE